MSPFSLTFEICIDHVIVEPNLDIQRFASEWVRGLLPLAKLRAGHQPLHALDTVASSVTTKIANCDSEGNVLTNTL